jgi:hypothetical protein
MRPASVEVLQGLTVGDVESLHREAFERDPTEFDFVFIGDLPEDAVRGGVTKHTWVWCLLGTAWSWTGFSRQIRISPLQGDFRLTLPCEPPGAQAPSGQVPRRASAPGGRGGSRVGPGEACACAHASARQFPERRAQRGPQASEGEFTMISLGSSRFSLSTRRCGVDRTGC